MDYTNEGYSMEIKTPAEEQQGKQILKNIIRVEVNEF